MLHRVEENSPDQQYDHGRQPHARLHDGFERHVSIIFQAHLSDNAMHIVHICLGTKFSFIEWLPPELLFWASPVREELARGT